MSDRILVLGGSGFVGANLVTELLSRGLEVRSFDRVPSRLPDHPRLQSVVGDITDLGDVTAAIDQTLSTSFWPKRPEGRTSRKTSART